MVCIIFNINMILSALQKMIMLSAWPALRGRRKKNLNQNCRKWFSWVGFRTHCTRKLMYTWTNTIYFLMVLSSCNGWVGGSGVGEGRGGGGGRLNPSSLSKPRVLFYYDVTYPSTMSSLTPLLCFSYRCQPDTRYPAAPHHRTSHHWWLEADGKGHFAYPWTARFL